MAPKRARRKNGPLTVRVRPKILKRVRTRSARKVERGRAMDNHAREYVAILTDPCAAPLAKLPATGNSGFVLRAETDFILGAGATDTAAFISWTPSAIALDGTGIPGPNLTGLLVGAGATDGSNITPQWYNGVPAIDYLRTNASAYRVVAACLQVFWPGSELNRQGVVSMVNAPSNTIVGTYGTPFPAVATTVSKIRSSSQVVSRMPTDRLELVWRPGDLDFTYADPNSSITGDGKNAMIMSFAGLPVSTGVRVRLVGVYEWVPKPLNGLIPSLASSTESNWTPGELRTWLDKNVPGWTYHLDPSQRGTVAHRILQAAGVVAFNQVRNRIQMRG